MGYQVKSGGIIRELDKEPLLHCSSIYINTMWSMLQQCVYLMSIHHASISCPITHSHVFFLRPPCFLHVLWCYTFNLRCTCAHYVYTMRNPCSLMSYLTLTPHLDSLTWLLGHMLSIRCRLIIILTIYVWLTLILAKVCSHSHLITIIQHLQIQIWSNLSFSGYAVPLYIIIVIFWKEVVTESKSLWKSDFQTWVLRIMHYTS